MVTKRRRNKYIYKKNMEIITLCVKPYDFHLRGIERQKLCGYLKFSHCVCTCNHTLPEYYIHSHKTHPLFTVIWIYKHSLEEQGHTHCIQYVFCFCKLLMWNYK